MVQQQPHQRIFCKLPPRSADVWPALAVPSQTSRLTLPTRIVLKWQDYNIEARMAEPRNSSLWGDDYFGPSVGDPAHGHAIISGRSATEASPPSATLRHACPSRAPRRIRSPSLLRYADWKLADAEGALGNGHGLRRSPWNLNPSRQLTRYPLSCGSSTTFRTALWETCAAMPTYVLWYACIDPTVHTWAHSFIGGIWDTRHAAPRIPCYVENSLLVPELHTGQCIDCPAAGGCNAPNASAPCACTAVSDLKCEAARPLVPTAIYGDFADAWTSPNDPIFFVHHANVDRNLMAWQRRHSSGAPTYGFPSVRGPLPPGHALGDVIAPADPFVAGEVKALGLDPTRRPPSLRRHRHSSSALEPLPCVAALCGSRRRTAHERGTARAHNSGDGTIHLRLLLCVVVMCSWENAVGISASIGQQDLRVIYAWFQFTHVHEGMVQVHVCAPGTTQ